MDSKIQTSEDFLRIYQREKGELARLFVTYSKKKLEGLATIDVGQAMDAVRKGSRDEYLNEQFDHLFRLSSALWSFSKSSINEVQQSQYDKIINLGVYDQEQGAKEYDRFVKAVKLKYDVRADHTFSTTHDPYRIWLLNYAAALPIYFLSGLRENKRRYQDEITPTYHIDSYFEMNVPDLFPTSDVDNLALRVLGMAIVPGIDVVQDHKLVKGHKFICDLEAVKKLYFGDPKVWILFREMYEEVKNSYGGNETDNLLDILKTSLEEKVRSIPANKLREMIQVYINKVRVKLANRDFSRLISARLTYREITELEQFLSPVGYAMDIDRYIAGR